MGTPAEKRHRGQRLPTCYTDRVGTGNITLYWYALCCLGAGFIFAVAGGLIAYGKWQTRKKKKQRALQRAAKKARKKKEAQADGATTQASGPSSTGGDDPSPEDRSPED